MLKQQAGSWNPGPKNRSPDVLRLDMPYDKKMYVRRGETINRWYFMAIAHVGDFKDLGVLQIPHAAPVAEYKRFFTKKGLPKKSQVMCWLWLWRMTAMIDWHQSMSMHQWTTTTSS